MPLLHIQEKESGDAVPENADCAFGIDLGTTHSLIAVCTTPHAEGMQDTAVHVFSDRDGHALLPSVVHYRPEGCVVGKAALAYLHTDPSNTIASIKRLMGRGYEAIAHNRFPYDFVSTPGLVTIKTAWGLLSPIEITADILSALKNRVMEQAHGPVRNVVLSVPAYFDEAQRQSTKDAAQLAGLNVLRLINEPTAAAIAYGLDNDQESVFAVYDLGGGTFDISILKKNRGVLEVIATGGNTELGGNDFDHIIADILCKKHRFTEMTIQERASLMREARVMKEALSSCNDLSYTLHLSETCVVSGQLTRCEFAACSHALTQKTLLLLRQTVHNAQLEMKDIDALLLVGGATRMPQIREALEQFLGHPLITTIDPEEAVVRGSALQARQLSQQHTGENSTSWLLLDVVPLSLGLEVYGGITEKIIPRNTTIPAIRQQEFTTWQDNQTIMSIHIVQGERNMVADCRSLAQFQLTNIPALPRGTARIEITFQIDADGLLSVTAREKITNITAHIIVKPSYGLGEEDIHRMLEESNRYAVQDVKKKQLHNQYLLAQELLNATHKALEQDGHLLSVAEKENIMHAVQQLRNAAAQDNEQSIRQCMQALDNVTRPFARLRINQPSVKEIIGKKMDDTTQL